MGKSPPTVAAPRAAFSRAQQDPAWVRWTLAALAVGVLTVLIVVPVVSVFSQALSEGVRVYWDNLVSDHDTRHAILLTLAVAPVAVALNIVFGVAAAWLIARFRFR